VFENITFNISTFNGRDVTGIDITLRLWRHLKNKKQFYDNICNKIYYTTQKKIFTDKYKDVEYNATGNEYISIDICCPENKIITVIHPNKYLKYINNK